MICWLQFAVKRFENETRVEINEGEVGVVFSELHRIQV